MKKMHLAFDFSWTHVEGRWRTPGSWTGRTFPNLDIFEEMAKIAERGCFDMIFFGDGSGIPSTWRNSPDEAIKWGISWPRQDMSPFIVAMSRVTKNIGFGLTYASTFMHPFYVARLLNSLDHVTNGRMAFNVVTSTRIADAENYGFDELMEHSARYDRMEEFMDVCLALWKSVEPDAFIWDRETGVVADPSKIHAINHKGRFFKVKGPLNTMPSPQGHPVLIQAGGSARGTRAAAHFVDHVFAANKPLPQMLQQRKDVDEALIAERRDPSKVGIIWGLQPIVAETEREAKERKEQLLKIIPPEGAGVWISNQSGYDFAKLPNRFKLKDLQAEIVASNATPVGLVHRLSLQLGEDAEISREDFLEAGLRMASGYEKTVAGTAKQLADHMEEIFVATGERGGFMLEHPPSSPRDLLAIVDFLIPELQRRGRFRTQYEGKTLRENLAT